MYFRKAGLEDIDEFVRLRIKFMREVNGSINDNDESKYEALVKGNSNYFRENIENNRFIAWLAIDKERIIGTSGLVFYDRPPSFKNPSGKIAYIMNIYTLTEYRKQGIASLLLEKAIGEAESMGYTTISLNATEMGKTLYLNRGFQDVHGEMTLKLQ